MINEKSVLENYSADTANSIIEAFYNELVSEEDQKLLNLAFAKNIDQAKLDEFLNDWDIEKFGERKSLLLSYVMKANPDLKFSNYEKPRLEGLLKFHRFRNLKLISHYAKIVRALNQENIFPMILKGGAMKHIRADLPRPMEDIDILIPSEDEFLRASEIAKNLGYVFKGKSKSHSFDLHLPDSDEGTVDLHRYICMESKYDQEFLKDLFARSKKQKVFGTESFVPIFEDLLFLGLINLSRNLHSKTSLGGILYSLFDFKYLIENKADFNWDLVLENIVRTKTYSQALLAMKFINKIIPEMLPESLLKNEKINKKFIRYCDRVMFYRFYLHDLKMRCKALKIKDALQKIDLIKEYISKKPKYFMLKNIKKSYFLIRIFLIMNGRKQIKI